MELTWKGIKEEFKKNQEAVNRMFGVQPTSKPAKPVGEVFSDWWFGVRYGKIPFSDRAKDYVIESSNYERDNDVDRYFIKKCSQLMGTTFGGFCCNCEVESMGLAYDHFWLPKSKGGNLPVCEYCKVISGIRTCVSTVCG